MMRKKIFTLITSVLITSLTIAQESPLIPSRSTLISTGNNIRLPADYLRNNLLGNNDLPNNLVGSQYANEEFQSGKIFVNDSVSYNAMLRYNGYTDEIELQKDGKVSGLFKRPYLSALINDENFSIHSYNTDEGQKSGYFISLATGNTSLFKKESKIYTPGKTASSTYSRDTPPSFRDEVQYFILTKNNKTLQKVKLKQKSIFEVLGEDSLLKKYVKENDLDLKKESDLIQLINYYNNLIAS